MSCRILNLVVAVCIAGAPEAQRAWRVDEVRLRDVQWPPQVRGPWYSGDTHEHVQNCNGTVFPPSSVLQRMEEEDLEVASLLVWHRGALPFGQFVCEVTGEPVSISTATRVMQYGVETSGLDCSKWGHLVGLGIGPEQARIAMGSSAAGACDDMPGLGLGCEGGDGTGTLNAPIAAHFATAPEAVTGYAHTAWPLGIHHPQGFDWNTELLASGFTTDARFLDPTQRLSFPNLNVLIEPLLARTALDHDEGTLRTFMPLFAPVDAALGEAQFFETTYMGVNPPIPTTPPSNWFGLYYKLLSAGLRIAVTAGSDRACPIPDIEHPQTSVPLPGGLTYDGWTRGVALGRTSLGIPRVRLELVVGSREIGSELHLDGPGASATAGIRLVSGRLLQDTLELVVDGVVVRSAPVSMQFGGTLSFTFEDVPFTASSWVVARLASQRAHTAAVYVIVDGAPIAEPHAAEYWMMWCDAVTKRALERPDLELFGCQEALALDRLARARRAFQVLRDVDGIDPTWGVTRRGISSGACRGPITIGVTAPVVAGQPFRLTCVNAPAEAQGIAYVSRAAATPETCVLGATRLVGTEPPELLAALPVTSTRSGFAEAIANAPIAGTPRLFVQFVWQNPEGCTSRSCDANPATESASDALEIVVH